MVAQLIPGPRGLPLLGHLPGLLRDPLAFLTRLSREHGDVAAFQIGAQSAVLLNEPSLIDRVLKDRAFERSPQTRRAMRSLLGDGLLAIEGAPHLRHRRLLQPAFHRERIRRYVDVMLGETYAALDSWQSGQVRDLRADMSTLTFSIVARALFSSDARREAESVSRALAVITPAMLRQGQLERALPFALPLLYSPATRRAIRELHALVHRLVATRRREGEDRGDLLSMLLATRDEDGGTLSDEEIGAEALTILLAGHETTAATMAWAWHLLTQHPALQEALAAEVRTVAGDRPITFDDLPRLSLGERVIRETLRLYPAAWWADRVNAQPVQLGRYSLPAHTQVVFSTWVTHRDARFFEDPETFDPDRFSPERVGDIPDGAYLPFGGGVHVCIGNTFASMEARVILAAMAQRFQLQATPGHRVKVAPHVILNMAAPFPLVPLRRPPMLASASALEI